MRRVIGTVAMTVALGMNLLEAAHAAPPLRWTFDIVDAQTSVVMGSAGVVALIDRKAAPAVAYYSLQVSSKVLAPGGYRARLDVNGLQRTVDFSPESTGEVRVRVEPMLTLVIHNATAAVPSINVYSGADLAYRGVLRRGDSGSGPADGMGWLSGQCGALTGNVIAASVPYLFRNMLDFGNDPYDATDFSRLSPGAQAILGSSTQSTGASLARAFAFEVLRRCEGAQLSKTAEEIRYVDPAGKRTDMLVEIGGRKVGVTATRAYSFPPGAPYTLEVAGAFLDRKLNDVLLSSQNVAVADKWVKQVLHVFADTHEQASMLEAAYAGIDPALKANTILLITVSDGADAALYQ